MRTYIIRRLLHMIPTLIGISIIVYAISAMIPGDYITALNNPNMTQERADQLRAIYGLDQPEYLRYFTWVKSMLMGDMGDSFQHKKPVMAVVNDYVWNSFIIAVAVLILS